MQKKLEIVLPNQKQPFTHFELDLTSEEKECLSNFKIEKQQDLDGILDNLEQSLEQINTFISSLGENDLHSCSTMVHIIFKLAHQALTILQQECAHIIMRASVPHDFFKIPRWHQDGDFFGPSAGHSLKAVMTLKGPGTLFYSPTTDELEKFKQIENDRNQLAELLIDQSRTQSTPSGLGSLFIFGEEAGAVHSEPHINSQRFFMAVLPGSKNQIQNYVDRQKTNEKIQKIVVQMQKEGKSPEEIAAALQTRISSEMEENKLSNVI